jgi:predicted enzyme related to lactoylglutathione lyase
MAELEFDRVAPVVPVRDLDEAIARYAALGFDARTDDGPDRYGFADRGDIQLHIEESPEHDGTRDGAQVYLYVSDADALYAEWHTSGVAGRFVEPHDTPYGLREFAFVDTDGTRHRVGSPLPGR